ncbi:MAG: class I SAM-dependent methyltransferase [Thermodesulfobacteriota bacterium]
MSKRKRDGIWEKGQVDKAVAMTGRFLHERVLEITAKLPRGRVLDIPCGQGALADRLRAQGFEIFCGDLDPEWYRIEGGHFHLMDLNGNLPYKDQYFDCVTCVEGIEHLENPHLLIREIGRVLKPGGSVVITTPNIMNIKSRLYFLLRSYFNNFRYFPQPSNQRELLGLHVNPIPFGELRYILNRYGFRIETVSCNRFTRKYPWLMPFLMPLIRFMTRWKNREARFLLRRELLEGDILIISALKEDSRTVSP